MGINDRDTDLDLQHTQVMYGKESSAVVPQCVYQSGVASDTSSTTTNYVASFLLHKNNIQKNAAFRVTLAGSKSQANGHIVCTLYLLDGAILTLTGTATTAIDWYCEMTMVFSGINSQSAYGSLIQLATAAFNDTATATKAISNGNVTFKVGVAADNSSDTVTTNYVRVDYISAPQAS